MRITMTISIEEEDHQKIKRLALIENKTKSEYVRSIIRSHWYDKK